VCTDIAGSSAWFDRGFVTYSNAAKEAMLGVPRAVLEGPGAVSEETVLAMVEGALRHSDADWTLAISGIAGPDGGSDAKPVGTVWFAWAGPGHWRQSELAHFAGDRDAVRRQAVEHALLVLLRRVERV
jgi:nicotinamide-nucleotide amidase